MDPYFREQLVYAIRLISALSDATHSMQADVRDMRERLARQETRVDGLADGVREWVREGLREAREGDKRTRHRERSDTPGRSMCDSGCHELDLDCKEIEARSLSITLPVVEEGPSESLACNGLCELTPSTQSEESYDCDTPLAHSLSTEECMQTALRPCLALRECEEHSSTPYAFLQDTTANDTVQSSIVHSVPTQCRLEAVPLPVKVSKVHQAVPMQVVHSETREKEEEGKAQLLPAIRVEKEIVVEQSVEEQKVEVEEQRLRAFPALSKLLREKSRKGRREERERRERQAKSHERRERRRESQKKRQMRYKKTAIQLEPSEVLAVAGAVGCEGDSIEQKREAIIKWLFSRQLTLSHLFCFDGNQANPGVLMQHSCTCCRQETKPTEQKEKEKEKEKGEKEQLRYHRKHHDWRHVDLDRAQVHARLAKEDPLPAIGDKKSYKRQSTTSNRVRFNRRKMEWETVDKEKKEDQDDEIRRYSQDDKIHRINIEPTTKKELIKSAKCSPSGTLHERRGKKIAPITTQPGETKTKKKEKEKTIEKAEKRREKKKETVDDDKDKKESWWRMCKREYGMCCVGFVSSL